MPVLSLIAFLLFLSCSHFTFFTLDSGPPGTAYEGAVLPGILTFPKDYPLLPPKVRLFGQVFHPNGNVQ